MFKIAVFAVLLASAIAAPAAPASDDASATVTNFNNQVNPDGSFAYQFDTSNGIKTQASGTAAGAIQGQVEYSSLEGEPIQLTFVADENGYQPTGSHIPAIPEYIIRSLEYIRAHPSKDTVVKA